MQKKQSERHAYAIFSKAIASRGAMEVAQLLGHDNTSRVIRWTKEKKIPKTLATVVKSALEKVG